MPRLGLIRASSSATAAPAASMATPSSNYTVADNVRYVKATGGASGIDVTLPTPTAGRLLDVKKDDTGAGPVTLIGTVDGVTNPTLDYQGDSLSMVADGASWGSF